MTDHAAAKLVIAGPVGAGKTTAIRAITDGEPVSTEMPLSDGAMGDKTTTTVALDFSTVTLDDGTPLLVYGLPGQEHFAFMRPILLQGALGAVVLLDGRSDGIAAMCSHWLQAVDQAAPAAAIVVGITHTDLVRGFSLAPVRDAARCLGRPVPVFTIDARSRAQATQLVRALLASAGALA